MLKPKITPLNVSYKGKDSGLWALNTDDIPISKDPIKDQQIIYFDPGAIGGNHKHPRTEWFIGIGELVFYWLDSNKVLQSLQMNLDNKLLLIEVPPFLPHAVVNASKSDFAVLFEYADAKQNNLTKVFLLSE